LKNDVTVPSKSTKQKNFFKTNKFFVDVLKVNDENSRAGSVVRGVYSQIRIRTKMSWIRIPQHCLVVSWSLPKLIQKETFCAVFQIRIHMFLGHPDPELFERILKEIDSSTRKN
jgi:hypothetical protein